jgi:GxxExxY protein
LDERVEAIAAAVVDCGLRVHKALGPGLLESVYEAVLADGLSARGFAVLRQQTIGIEFEGRRLAEGFRIDLLIDDLLIVEIKSVEQLSPLHGKQLLTYLRLAGKPLGLLINFNVELLKDGGIKRVANGYHRNAPFPSPSSSSFVPS